MSFIYINPRHPEPLRSVRRVKPAYDGYVALTIRMLSDAVNRARGYVDRADSADSYATQVIEARQWLESDDASAFAACLAAMGYSVPSDLTAWVRAHEHEWPVPDAHHSEGGREALARAASLATRRYRSFAPSTPAWVGLVASRKKRGRPAPAPSS